jgi:hypothetical protein
VAGTAPASRIFADELVVALQTARPGRAGECLVIPGKHVGGAWFRSGSRSSGFGHVPEVARDVLDEHARLLHIDE